MSNATEVVFILDRSGSMARQESDIIGGFNAMLEKQRNADYPALVTTILFNNRLHVLHDRVPLDQVSPMTCSDYCVGGSTALLDAMGEAIHHIQKIHKYAREEDRPTKTLFVIMTDGFENSSHNFSSTQIKKMVRDQETGAGWEFMFIGADIDAFSAADGVGIRPSGAFHFSKANDSYAGCLDAVGDVMSCVATAEGKLNDNDWDCLARIFSHKKKK